MFCHRYPTEACVVRKTIPSEMLAGCEAFGTKASLSRPVQHSRAERPGWQPNRERKLRLLAPKRSGARPVLRPPKGWRGMVNPGESPINLVTENKPKVLGGFGRSSKQSSPARARRLGPKGKGSGTGAPNSPVADGAPPAERRNLTHAGTCTERGKPVGLLPSCKVRADWDRKAGRGRGSEPQGASMGRRVKEGGGSQSQPVAGWIGVELSGCDRERRRMATSPHAKAGPVKQKVLYEMDLVRQLFQALRKLVG